MAELIAKMPGGGFSMEDAQESVCCLDPWMVLGHFRAEFGEALVVDKRDWSRRTYEHLARAADASGAADVALRDAQRRGPMLKFRIDADGSCADGLIERYRIRCKLEGDSTSLADRLATLLKRLPAPGLQVSVE